MTVRGSTAPPRGSGSPARSGVGWPRSAGGWRSTATSAEAPRCACGRKDGDMADLKAVRVVLADDHPIWRSGVRNDLGSNFHVVGEAGDADEAIAVITSTK